MTSTLLATAKSTRETVRSLDWWTDSLFCLRISRPPGYRFTPGQFSRLGLAELAAPHAVSWRAYSITSASDDPFLEFYGIKVPGGAFTGAVSALRAGDPILLEQQPNGFMTLDRFVDGDSLWMLATGTGIGPYLSILQDAPVWRQFRDLIVVHCVRHAEELAYQPLLQALQARAARDPTQARLHLVQSVTRDTGAAMHAPQHRPDQTAASTTAAKPQTIVRLHARIPAMLADGSLQAAAGVPLDPGTARLMLCGNPAMIEDTRRLLHERGFRPCRRALPGQFLTENYW